MTYKMQKEFRFITLMSSCFLLISMSMTACFADSTIKTTNPIKTTKTNKHIAEQTKNISEETVIQSNPTNNYDQAAINENENENESTEITSNKDPLEKFNRAVFTFNDKFDIYFMKPIAELYNAIMPRPLNKGIHNVFVNISETSTIANDILQFNFYQMSKDTSRLVINTTMGIGGLFDIASRMRLPHFHNDFGLTLARWGYTDSSYLVLPFLGSNTIRDGLGIPVDYYGFSAYPYIKPESARYQVLALFFVDYRANTLEFEPVLEEVAIDKYTFMRNAYFQRRAFQIEQIKHLGYKDRNEKNAQGDVTAEQIK